MLNNLTQQPGAHPSPKQKLPNMPVADILSAQNCGGDMAPGPLAQGPAQTWNLGQSHREHLPLHGRTHQPIGLAIKRCALEPAVKQLPEPST